MTSPRARKRRSSAGQPPAAGEPPKPPALAPLRCPACGATVPLGESAEARCGYCGAEVPVPPEYVALRTDARKRRDDAARLDELYAEASRPPARLLGLWGMIGASAGTVALIGAVILTVVTVLAVLVIELRGPSGFIDSLGAAAVAGIAMVFLSVPAFVETFGHLVGAHGRDLADALGPWFGVGVGGAVYVLLVIPTALGVFALDLVGGIERLRASLRAGKPLHAGGPATCRSCGAALDVPAGALGVRCVYCHSDNLVAVPEAALAAEQDETAVLHAQVDAALEAHRTERAATRRRLLPRLALGLLCLPVFGLLYFPAHWIMNDGNAGPTMWHAAAHHRGALWPLEDGAPIPETARGEGAGVPFAFPGFSCADRSGDACAYYFVALRRGERFRLVHTEQLRFGFGEHTRPRPGRLDQLEIHLQRHAHGFGACAGAGWVGDVGLDTPVPYTGWYRLAVRGPPGLETIEDIRWTKR